jgi:ribonuclease HI
VQIWTDGACSGNPGPGGRGALLRYGEVEKELCGGEAAPTTNNRMELTAPIRALTALTRASVVDLHTDSTYVRNGIISWMANWKRNGWRTKEGRPVKNEDLWRELDAAVARHDEVVWHWVKGHAGHVENERADGLAARGQRETLENAGIPVPPLPESRHKTAPPVTLTGDGPRCRATTRSVSPARSRTTVRFLPRPRPGRALRRPNEMRYPVWHRHRRRPLPGPRACDHHRRGPRPLSVCTAARHAAMCGRLVRIFAIGLVQELVRAGRA